MNKYSKGKLYIVGFGPGDEQNMTLRCRDCLEKSDILVGYSAYIALIEGIFPKKEVYKTPMTGEVERCRAAIEMARNGKTVCLISSGDSGIYGMAGLVFELVEQVFTDGVLDVEIEVVTGVTAAVSGAALLGAPIANDFAVISLSDLLTPWATIEKRLRGAALGDFSICLYNPSSKGRASHLKSACEILMEIIPENRLCGVAKSIGREGQTCFLTTLGGLHELKLDMGCTVFVGNSQTLNLSGRMVTQRGYGAKNDDKN